MGSIGMSVFTTLFLMNARTPYQGFSLIFGVAMLIFAASVIASIDDSSHQQHASE
jgi:hypothetical protein